MDTLVLELLAPAFLACLVLTGIHAYLGLHVLARGVIFVDIALAQIASLGTAIAMLRGVEPHTWEAYFWSLVFGVLGATLFALTRGLRRKIPQEAFIGISYVVAAAAVIVIANFLPHGDQELRELLVGNLLAVTYEHIGFMALLYGGVGIFHWIYRAQFLAMSFSHEEEDADAKKAMFWDLLFYLSFALVITTSVEVAGVLVVFSFLVVPSVFSALFTSRLGLRLGLAWVLGTLVSALGLYGSFQYDLPSGAAIVVTFGLALLLGMLGRLVLKPSQA